MKHLAADNGLEYGNDVKMISQGSGLDFKLHIDQNKNKTLFGILFCTTEWSTRVDISNTSMAKYAAFEQVGFDIPCKSTNDKENMYMYSVMYNLSLIPFDFESMMDTYLYSTLTRIKTSVDNGIIRELHKEKTGSYDKAPVIENSASRYPNVPDRIHAGFDASAVFGALYFFIPPLTVFSTIFNLMLREKSLKLRLGLHVFGLSSASHWTAWSITAIFYSLIPAIIFPVFGDLLGMDAFSNTPYIIYVVVFFVCSFSMS
jgi:hypothetical protein